MSESKATERKEWVSRFPIVVGNPSPAFEPRPADEKYHKRPYRSDSVLDGWGTEHFVVRGASLRGNLHRYNGCPRQDDFALCYLRDTDRLLIAVADGVSSADQSHLGSTFAVRASLQWLQANVELDPATADWSDLFKDVAWTLVEQSSSYFDVEKDATEAERLMATTLVCGVVDFPSNSDCAIAYIVSVGDSGAWILNELGFRPIIGGKTDLESGLTSSAVRGLPQVPTTIDMRKVDFSVGDVLLLGTDGFGDPLGSGVGELGDHFSSLLISPPPQSSNLVTP